MNTCHLSKSKKRNDNQTEILGPLKHKYNFCNFFVIICLIFSHEFLLLCNFN